MERCVSFNSCSSSFLKPCPLNILPFSFSPAPPPPPPYNRTRLILVVNSSSHCDFSSLNTPLEPKSPTGKFLSRVLQNDRKNFHHAVAQQLDHLISQRDDDEAAAFTRLTSTLGSAHPSLYSANSCTIGPLRIAEVKEIESQTAIEDVMYMLISYKFSEIRVHLVPRLSKCIYNGRLEILPSKDWELESIHSLEVLEMIREHLGSVIGWRADSNVTDNWATTNILKLRLSRIYTASILYGYFLKSASMRHCLELSLADVSNELGAKAGTRLSLLAFWSHGLDFAFGRVRNKHATAVGEEASCSRAKRHEKLSSYVMGFDPEVLQMCAKPKSKEAMNLIEKHSCALFGDENLGVVETDEIISTSLASLKRFVLEAVAFGSFLWDSEEYVETVYKLKEN